MNSINKAVKWKFYWTNSKGDRRPHKPSGHTVQGDPVSETELAAPLAAYPLETLLARAKRLGLIDTWIPRLQVIVNNKIVEDLRGSDAHVRYKQLTEKDTGKPTPWWKEMP